MPGAAPLARLARSANPWSRPFEYLVLLVTGWNLWSVRALLAPVSYLYDASVHFRMVQYATADISAGHLPFTSWFPYMGMGSEQFLHYQSLGAVITGLVGTIVGAGTAFRWSTYLMVALWPIVVYAGGHIWGLQRAVAATAAAIAPFVVSFTGIGFERGAYSWTGGAEVWTQLFGSWALCLGWALTWQALQQPRFAWMAAAVDGLTIDFHFLSGYLALLGIAVMCLLAPGHLRQRLRRGAVVFAGSLLSASWVVVPLLVTSKWAAQNQALANTPYVRGYGARQELEWLFTGQLFDARRWWPALTIVVLAGALMAARRWRGDATGRALLGLFLASYLLSFGPTTWGPVMDLVPAHADLYFRRFTMGVQLAGLYLGAAFVVGGWNAVADRLRSLNKASSPSQETATARAGRRRMVVLTVLTAGTVAWFVPAWSEIASYDVQDAAVVHTQQASDRAAAPYLSPILAYVQRHGGGRIYAGLSDNWGAHFMVGYVQMYKYLETQNVDLMAYMVPTLSPMLGAETYFVDSDPPDYGIFGVRYLILPTGSPPPVACDRALTSGPYTLWDRPQDGYVETVRVEGSVDEDRADVGSVSAPLLASLGPHEDAAVRWDGAPTSAKAPFVPALSSHTAPGPHSAPGRVVTQTARLARGYLSARVDMAQPGTLLASVAYDPGWQATVDGRPAPVSILAPAVMGVAVGRGLHTIVLQFHGFRWYPELWALSVLTLVSIGALERRSRYGRQASGAHRLVTGP
jgi:hypothetical protein